MRGLVIDLQPCLYSVVPWQRLLCYPPRSHTLLCTAPVTLRGFSPNKPTSPEGGVCTEEACQFWLCAAVQVPEILLVRTFHCI